MVLQHRYGMPVNLRDILGRSILDVNSTNSISEVDVAVLSKGIYFIRLTSETNKTKTIKLIKI